ncbi:pirin family protein [Austwickia chelonae]|uniref:pirin family protein n=1 Tax=Austwickia chelonae TaxID=100225 RepID=UPI0013C377E9|nr:pirin-like C-terminal cupin domain-containing protein [Austwickia chelonae]
MDPIRLVVSPRHATDNGRRRAPDGPGSGTDPAPSTPDGDAGGSFRSADRSGGHAGLPTRRTLPDRRLTAIGAWCLLEDFGDPSTRPTLLETVAYPEAGIQSVTWPIDGLIRRQDSLGTDVVMRHGTVCIGTAGSGITVAESGVDDPRGGRHARRFLHGVRLAAALPPQARGIEPGCQEITDPPRLNTPTMRATVLVGSLAGPHSEVRSPAEVHTPLTAADITLTTGTERLTLDPLQEHGVLLIDGEVSVNRTPIRVGDLAYVPVGREQVDLATHAGCRVILLGGTPFDHEFILWWNIVAGSHDEIVAARESWQADDGHFGRAPLGAVRAVAPPIPPVRLRPRRGSLRHRG